MINRHHQALRRQAVVRFLLEDLELDTAASAAQNAGNPPDPVQVIELAWRKAHAPAEAPALRF